MTFKMTFAKLFYKSNSSILMYGNVLQGTIECIRGNKVIMDTGMRPSFVCSQNELRGPGGGNNIKTVLRDVMYSYLSTYAQGPRTKSFCFLRSNNKMDCNSNVPYSDLGRGLKPISLRQRGGLDSLTSFSIQKVGPTRLQRSADTFSHKFDKSFVPHAYDVDQSVTTEQERGLKNIITPFTAIGIEEKRLNKGNAFSYIAPVEKLSIRKLVWADIERIYRTSSSVKGFILNSVNGGYAVAIAGYIAFLPRSLRLNKKVRLGQWRRFVILSMNPSIENIVVKEIRSRACCTSTEVDSPAQKPSMAYKTVQRRSKAQGLKKFWKLRTFKK